MTTVTTEYGLLFDIYSPSLVTCRGRRRIGKSTLIARFAELFNARLIKIEGLRLDVDMSNEDELAIFAEQLSLYVGVDIPIAKNWLNVLYPIK